MQSAADEQIFIEAARSDQIIVSADTDFATLLALRHEAKPSVILLRRTALRRPQQQAALLVTNLPALENALLLGCVAVFEEGRIRVRQLPIGG